MMDVKENITAREFLRSLLMELDEHRQSIAEIEALIPAIEKRLGTRVDVGAAASVVSENANGTNTEAEPAKDEPLQLSLTGLSRKRAAPLIVKAAGRWLTAQEILDYMAKGGLNVGAKTAKLSLYPLLEAHPELQSAKGYGGIKKFGLKDWVLPASVEGNGSLRHWRSARNGAGSMGDAAEQILTNTAPLHADMLVAALDNLGIHVTKKNMVDGLRRDGRNRFKNLGGNMWTLRKAK